MQQNISWFSILFVFKKQSCDQRRGPRTWSKAGRTNTQRAALTHKWPSCLPSSPCSRKRVFAGPRPRACQIVVFEFQIKKTKRTTTKRTKQQHFLQSDLSLLNFKRQKIAKPLFSTINSNNASNNCSNNCLV